MPELLLWSAIAVAVTLAAGGAVVWFVCEVIEWLMEESGE